MQAITGVTVVIPVFNAEATLANVARQLETVLPALAPSYEIILVNDGSRDGSWPLIESLAAANPKMKGINLARNYGQHNATLAGIRAAGQPVIVTMDADGQHPAEALGELLAGIVAGQDVVYGYAEKSQHSGLRYLATLLVRWLGDGLALFPDSRKVSAFRVFRTGLRDAFTQCHAPYVSVDALLRWGTDRFSFIPVPYKPRQGGKSSSTVMLLGALVMNTLTMYSMMPILLIEMLGVAMMLMGMGALLLARDPLIWVASVVAVGAGAIMIAVGVVGEYAARHYMLAIGRPQSVIREKTDYKK